MRKGYPWRGSLFDKTTSASKRHEQITDTSLSQPQVLTRYFPIHPWKHHFPSAYFSQFFPLLLPWHLDWISLREISLALWERVLVHWKFARCLTKWRKYAMFGVFLKETRRGNHELTHDFPFPHWIYLLVTSDIFSRFSLNFGCPMYDICCSKNRRIKPGIFKL